MHGIKMCDWLCEMNKSWKTGASKANHYSETNGGGQLKRSKPEADWKEEELLVSNVIFAKVGLYPSSSILFENTESGRETWRLLSYNKMKCIPSFKVNLLLKLSLSESILITIFTSWIWFLWGGVPCCQHIPASGGLLTKIWSNRSMFPGVLSEGCLSGRFLFAEDAVSLKFLTHNSTVLRLWTLSFRWIMKSRRNIRWLTTPERLY